MKRMKRMKRKQRLIDSVREGFLRIRKNPQKPLGLFAIMHPDGTFLNIEQFYDEDYGYTNEFYYDYFGHKNINAVFPIHYKKVANREIDDFMMNRYEYDDTNDSDAMFDENEYERLRKRFKLVKVPKRIIRKTIRTLRNVIEDNDLSGVVYFE